MTPQQPTERTEMSNIRPCSEAGHCWHAHGFSMPASGSGGETVTQEHCCYCGIGREVRTPYIHAPQVHGPFEMWGGG